MGPQSVAAIPDIPLSDALALVERAFDCRSILRREIGDADLVDYYGKSDPGYLRFHSPQGALHIGLGHVSAEGHATHARMAQERFDALGARHVLELGCGMGFNAVALAQGSPDRRVEGIDLTEGHVNAARRAGAGLPNLRIVQGSYHQLPWQAGEFDAALAVETLCQSTDLPQALSEAARVLRPGGRLLNIDCFRSQPIDRFPEDLQTAMRLVEKTTAVNFFRTAAEWQEIAGSVGLRAVEVLDHSEATGPDLRRIYTLARRFFRIPWGARLLRLRFPQRMLENAACGLLMPYTVGQGGHHYLSVLVEKSSP